MDDNQFTSSKRRHTLPSTSFVDPAIVRFIEKASSSTSTSVIQDDNNDVDDIEEGDDQRTTISTISLPQQLDYHQYQHHKKSSSHLDQLWSRQEKYDNLELRLLALEVTKKRFEHRLQVLEDSNSHQHHQKQTNTILLQQQQPMKPDQQQQHQQHAPHDDKEMLVTQHPLYLNLLDKYTLLLKTHEEKEKYYQQRIQDLLLLTNQQEEEEASYKEENGYLIFDTTNMNGEIIHCKVKIPPPAPAPIGLASPPATRVGSPQYQTPLPNSSKKKQGLNYNAPEWKNYHHHHPPSSYYHH